MDKTKIDWADSTWNPVTGCLHGCEYCYARGIAERFGGASETHCNQTVGTECQWVTEATGETHELEFPVYDVDRGKNAPYPFEFDPTFHRYRLDDYRDKKGRTIFVGSMCDLFGNWVPDEWIREVFAACERAPQHRYLFLTKNPARLDLLQYRGELPISENFWYGTTITGSPHDNPFFSGTLFNTFVSCEPLLTEISPYSLLFSAIRDRTVKWVIIGAETGRRKKKLIPKREWIENIVRECRGSGVPVFMKESLRDIMGGDFVKEFPWKEEGEVNG